jgi:hypothetical protein
MTPPLRSARQQAAESFGQWESGLLQRHQQAAARVSIWSGQRGQFAPLAEEALPMPPKREEA